MTRISAINWHRDGWIEIEGGLTIEGQAGVDLTLFLPEDKRQTDNKTVAIWNGESALVRPVRRGQVTRLGTFRPDGAPLRLHLFFSEREKHLTDVRRLGAILIVKAEEEPVFDQRFDPAGPGRTFLAHPDRALVTEFMNIPRYLAAFSAREAPSDPVLHYLLLGCHTGHDPAVGFSSADYLAATPGLAESGINPFVHFLQATLGPEGAADPSARDPRTISALAARLRGETEEDATSTAAAGPDLSGGYDGEEHTTPLRAAAASLATGNREEAFRTARAALRDPAYAGAAAALLSRIIGTTETWERIAAAMAALFDARFYTAQHSHALRGGGAADQHYLLTGWQRGHRPSAFFDPVHYASQLPGGLPEGAFPLAHYHGFGLSAGLQGAAEGAAHWPVPDLPAPDPVVEPRDEGDIAAVVHLVLDAGTEDPCPTLRSLIGGRGSAHYDICVTDAGNGDALPWHSELDGMAEAGHITLRRGGGAAETTLAASLAAREGPPLPVVVMTRDAEVFPGWLDRLLAHALTPPETEAGDATARIPVATVTALSTHAGFAAYPVADTANLAAPGMAASEIDRLAATTNAGQSVAAPGAGGACVLITVGALGNFALDSAAADPVAALGRQAHRAGWRNLVAADVFVPRTGRSVPVLPPSDTMATGQAQLAADDPLAADFVVRHRRAQPLRAARRRLDLGRLAAACAGATVHLSHRLGGGVETYLQAALRSDPGAVVLRLFDGHRLTVETSARRGPFVPNLAGIDLRGAGTALAETLAAIGPGGIVLHSLTGLSWAQQADVLRALVEQPAPVTFIGHDYAPVSAQYCLFAPDGTPWSGPPSVATLRDWATMADPMAELGACDPAVRQDGYDRLFARAADLQVPSEAAAAVFRRYFPSRPFRVVPHAPHLPPAQALVRLPPDGRLRIAVPGKVGLQKGSRVIEALALTSRRLKLPFDITVVGHSDIDDRLTRLGVKVTGPYRQEAEALAQLSRISPDILFVPSLWPETFCYTLSFAAALGLPAVVFDLGAQAERARTMPGSTVLPLSLAADAEGLARALAALARPVALPPNRS